MSVSVSIPAVMQGAAGAPASIDLAPGTIREILHRIVRSYPELGGRIFAPGGDLQRFVNIYVDDEDLRSVGGLDASIADGSSLMVLSAVSGG